MNPHMPRQEGAGDMRRSMDPFNPNPLAQIINDSDRTAIQNYDKAASGGELVDGVHVVPGSMRFYEGIKEPADPVDEAQAIKIRQMQNLDNQQMTEESIRELKEGLGAMGLQDKPFNLEEKSKERHQQLDMENWVDHMTKPKLFNFYDESDGNASRSL